MNKLANVIYPYEPKNDDELELKVGDKIEVIGFEEAGWWKGRLKNRIGVFPSNFVQVIEASSPITPQPVTTTANSTANVANKLSLFSSKNSKTSLSANSLNSSNSNSNNNNSNNINHNNSNNNLIMNNTQHQDNSGLAGGEDSLITSSERRPKPIRGIGYGDIFASGGKPKPLPADPSSSLSNERLSTSLTTTLQKQIPKKPPPPAPITDISNGSSSEQAPALPPKPANQFSPHLQHPRSLSPAQQQQQQQAAQQVREQAKVIYPYEPKNEDELAINVGDIIDILDKDIEDVGWWKGELRGKVGVFPDNFVQLIEVPETPSQAQDWLHRSANTSQTAAPPFNLQASTENKFKSVFATTPKGFSKQLENNLEKHNSPASFLSLKRNKLQHQASATMTGESAPDENGKKETDVAETQDTNTTKLNHITANRAKGPSRRPPSNILNKRNQIDQIKREPNGKDDQSLVSLPANTNPPQTANDSLSSLPASQHAPQTLGQTLSSKPNHDLAPAAPPTLIKPSLSLDNVIENQSIAPKTSQRVTQAPIIDKNRSSASAATPSWMVELKKAHAERKRDSPTVVVAVATPAAAATTTVATTTTPTTPISIPIPISTTTTTNNEEPINKVEREKSPEKVVVDQAPALTSAQYDSLVRQISKNVTSEISELREEVKRLQQDFHGINELKSVLEVMKVELKACQSATENQKRYIKELVNNLSDERKKIAAMQVEIDRTLK